MGQKKIIRLAGCGIISIRSIFMTGMLIYQSRANLHEKILLVTLLIFTTQNLEKRLQGVCMEVEKSKLHSGLIYLTLKFKINTIVSSEMES